MRRFAGQVARRFAGLAHALARLALALVLLLVVGVGGLAWRLSRGPLDLAWVARRVEAAANAGGGPTRLRIGSAALAWEGWRLGLDRPLDLRLTDVAAVEAGTGGARLAAVPRAELSLSFSALLLGRLVPRALEIDGARIRVLRAADGGLSLDLGSLGDAVTPQTPDAQTGPSPDNPLGALLGELGRPPGTDRSDRAGASPWSQLRRVRIAGAEMVVTDRQLGATWRAPRADIDLVRQPQGGVEGSAEIVLALGDQTARLTAEATLRPGQSGTWLRVRVGRLAPAALAAAAPALAPLAAVEAPVEGEVQLELGPHLAIQRVALQAQFGAGLVHVARGVVPLRAATFSADGDRDAARLAALHVELSDAAGGTGPIVQGSGEARRTASGYAATLGLDVDRVPFADLARYWPEGTDGKPREGGARAWLTRNMTAGTAHDGHVDLALTLAGSDVTVTGLTGRLQGDDVSAFWLRPLPPIEHASAQLTVLSPDELLITAQNGRQSGGALVLRSGSMRITGLSQKDQIAALDLDLAGPVADTVGLLRQPRLRLLSRHPMDLRDPRGQVAAKLTLGLPLEDKLSIDEVAIHAQGHIADAHLAGVVAGRDLDAGALDFDVTSDGLKLGGTAALAGIPCAIGAELDFRGGPPTQVLQHYTAEGTASAQQLAAAGLDAGGVFTGSAGLRANVAERRDGSGEADLHADLARGGLALTQLGWRRAPGGPASADARVLLSHDRVVGLDRLAVQGEGIDVHGAAEFADGKPVVLRLDRLMLGETEAEGELHFPAAPAAPWRARLTGRSLDLSARFARHGEPQAKPSRPAGEDRPGPPWVADLRFDRVILGHDRGLTEVAAHAENDGRVVRQGLIEGRAGPGGPFRLAIAPGATPGGVRQMTATAGDAGALLHQLDLVSGMQGGSLTLSGSYDDSRADHPITGQAELTNFRLRDAPMLTRLLQAMTLYGMVDLLRGPGLGITRMVVPFRLAGDTLDLYDARAFSPSLGFTAKGRVDLAAETADLQGTIVPAYFFNTLLGNLPLVGRLFSPERGGGVFAATYSVRGRLDDPSVSVNPLAALTPGFLRGLFGIFGENRRSGQ